MGRTINLLLWAALVAMPVVGQADVRLKDIGRLGGWRENAIVGYGLVTGLAGTGDSGRSKSTRQSIANMLSRFDVNVTPDDIQSRNVAAVMVTASLPPFGRPGDAADVTVTSMGDARSLLGGTLVLAPLKGPDGRIYALAQGSVSVGGYKYDMNGNVVQKNHPTVGSIPGGAVVEVALDDAERSPLQKVAYILNEPDFTTASRVAEAINVEFQLQAAQARDASGVDIAIPAGDQARLVDFLKRVEGVVVTPDRRARVVINERTGVVVAGGDVRIDKVAISYGEMKVNIVTENSVSQPALIGFAGPEIRTERVSNSKVEVQEGPGAAYVAPDHNTVADLVQALARVKTSTRDIISILRAIKTAGALRGDLVIQ